MPPRRGQRAHRMARGGHTRRRRRGEDRFGFRIAAVDVVGLEQFDGERRNIFCACDLRRIDAEQFQVFAIGNAFRCLSAECRHCHGIELLGSAYAEQVVGHFGLLLRPVSDSGFCRCCSMNRCFSLAKIGKNRFGVRRADAFGRFCRMHDVQRRRNSEQTMPVAIATLSDSVVRRSAG